jgi:hypothetical protein
LTESTLIKEFLLFSKTKVKTNKQRFFDTRINSAEAVFIYRNKNKAAKIIIGGVLAERVLSGQDARKHPNFNQQPFIFLYGVLDGSRPTGEIFLLR